VQIYQKGVSLQPEMGAQKTLLSDSYLSIASLSEGAYKDNGSRFLSFAYPCTSAEQADEILTSIRKKYYDATHHCYAYRLGREGDTFRINDDGEPSSTAGRPIYGQILSNNLSDILLVVVRYFGGVKLGVPGLIKAYKTAAAEAIANSKIITKISTERYKIIFDYPSADKILKELKKLGIEAQNKKFESECSVEADIRLTDIERLTGTFKRDSHISFTKIEQEKSDNKKTKV
jgi:uncharacterized YigZ family protein